MFRVNSFQIPNTLIDQYMRIMTPNEFCCLTLIIRKTRGWNKETDKISISQFQEFTGIQRNKTLSSALESLRKRGFIEVVKFRGRVNEYRLTDLFSEVTNAPKSTGKFATSGKYASGKNPVDKSQKQGQIRPTTKGTFTKGEKGLNKPCEKMKAKGRELGIEPGDNESGGDFHLRILDKVSRDNFDAMQGE